ncbi:hypothetical protein CEXT_88741 [Caerostris extrusa]|uniref:Uncharacterized protein n=1 Tax=Caerostris extrusa TaxID=172846 RepID=A0AAV4X6V1_CAEEX|nr:hypothetical protein CEXT_88741 [Caerostris extrusa]
MSLASVDLAVDGGRNEREQLEHKEASTQQKGRFRTKINVRKNTGTTFFQDGWRKSSFKDLSFWFGRQRVRLYQTFRLHI